MDFSFSKEKLEARRPWAIALDKKQAADHKAAEKKAHAKFLENARSERSRALKSVKEQCDRAAKATYEQAKTGCRYSGDFNGHLANLDFDKGIVWPVCPKSTVKMLDQSLTWVRADGRKHYNIHKNGVHEKIHYLLTYDETAKPDVCQ